MFMTRMLLLHCLLSFSFAFPLYSAIATPGPTRLQLLLVALTSHDDDGEETNVKKSSGC